MAPRKKRNDVTVKVDASIHRKAKLVAGFKGIDLAEYLSDLLLKPVERDYERLRRTIAEENSIGGNPDD